MTRTTNFGRKRTYLDAELHSQDPAQIAGPAQEQSDDNDPKPKTSNESPPKKKQKRSKNTHAITSEDIPTTSRKSKRKKPSDTRRLKRRRQKLSETTCFACRQVGHTAKDCPKTTHGVEDNDSLSNSNLSIGICYRCGSKKHTLSCCKKPSDGNNPFPFASCFICNRKGHLASSCSQNTGKGIYPNGGCCKLCGETTHLARNCTMHQKGNDPTVVLGTAREGGADEDDFHTVKRTTMELERAEKREERVKKMLEVRKGVVSGVAVRLDNVRLPSAKKKVVVFR